MATLVRLLAMPCPRGGDTECDQAMSRFQRYQLAPYRRSGGASKLLRHCVQFTKSVPSESSDSHIASCAPYFCVCPKDQSNAPHSLPSAKSSM
jgi:hypothetical protein